MQSIERRIEALEQKTVIHDKPWLRIICEPGESPKDAAKREGIIYDEIKYNYIIVQIVDPDDMRKPPRGLSEDES
jgi:hypothetical protein